MELTFEQHANQARAAAKAAGCADCIHYAPDWRSRADALYAAANAAGIIPGNPYLLADGRMVVVCERERREREMRIPPRSWDALQDVWFFEPKTQP